jgi:hypothetical protein
MVYASKLKALASIKVMTTNNHVNRKDRQLEGDAGKYNGGGSMIDGRRCGRQST